MYKGLKKRFLRWGMSYSLVLYIPLILVFSIFVFSVSACSKKEGGKKTAQKQPEEVELKSDAEQKISGEKEVITLGGKKKETKEEVKKEETKTEEKSETQEVSGGGGGEDVEKKETSGGGEEKTLYMTPGMAMAHLSEEDEEVKSAIDSLSLSSAIDKNVIGKGKNASKLEVNFDVSSICSFARYFGSSVYVYLERREGKPMLLRKSKKVSEVCPNREVMLVDFSQFQDGIYNLWLYFSLTGTKNFNSKLFQDEVKYLSGKYSRFYVYVRKGDILVNEGPELYVSVGVYENGKWFSSHIIKMANSSIYKEGAYIPQAESIARKIKLKEGDESKDIRSLFFMWRVPHLVSTILLDRTPPALFIRDVPGSTESTEILIEGLVSDSSPFKLFINGKPVYVDEDGSFKFLVELSPGINNIRVSAVDIARNVLTKTFVVDMANFDEFFQRYMLAVEDGDKLEESLWEGEILKRINLFKDDLLKTANSSGEREKLLALYLLARGGVDLEERDLSFIKNFFDNKNYSDKAVYVASNVDSKDESVYSSVPLYRVMYIGSYTFGRWIFTRYLDTGKYIKLVGRIDKYVLADIIASVSSDGNPQKIRRIAKLGSYLNDESLKLVISREIENSGFSEDEKFALMSRVGGDYACQYISANIGGVGVDALVSSARYIADSCKNLNPDESGLSPESQIVLSWVKMKRGERNLDVSPSKVASISDRRIFKMGVEVISAGDEAEENLIEVIDITDDLWKKTIAIRMLGNVGGRQALLYLENLIRQDIVPYGFFLEVHEAMNKIKDKIVSR